ncbi:MAG TPA: TetR/AcrR family transcriptional regulator [Streptosporangiaceae bacterium]|nr:TetR/AcrR family transcriptional regulator [Streptosporangiaceae bacterium]
MTSHAGTKPPSGPRSARKRRAILDAATRVFLADGFAGASMDAIAAAAGVSKPTVYSHFADKQQLFEQIVTDMIAGIARPFYDQIVNLSDDGDLAGHLRELARLLLEAVMQPANLQLRRLVIGEADRFPDLGHAYEQQGPQRAIAAWTTAFTRLADQGLLRLDDPALAAEHFNWLVVSIPLNHAMLTGDHRPLPRTQLERYADRAVDVFLAAYGAVGVAHRELDADGVAVVAEREGLRTTAAMTTTPRQHARSAAPDQGEWRR